MSYMTPYYFSSSKTQPVGIWMRSNDFHAKIGVALSGSTAKLAEATGNAWGYNDAFVGASIVFPSTSSNIYVIEATSVEANVSGNFELYLTTGETSSVDFQFSIGGVNNLVYNIADDVVVSIGTRTVVNTFPTGAVTSSISIVNPKSCTVSFSSSTEGLDTLDLFYNPNTQNVWIWQTGSQGHVFVEYNGNGSIVTSHTLNADLPWLPGGNLAYNSDKNHVLLVPFDFHSGTLSTASIYDCTNHTIVKNIPLPTSNTRFPAYVSSTQQYYITSDDGTTAAFKIDANTYAVTTINSMTSSGYGLSYIAEVDRLFLQSPTSGECVIIDPSTDTPVASITGIYDFEGAIYNPCSTCITIWDDNISNNGFTDGGLACVSTSSFQPIDFKYLTGIWKSIYIPTTKTIYATNYNDNVVHSFCIQLPTGSLPQP